MKRSLAMFLLTVLITGMLVMLPALPGHAECEKFHGQWTCTTFDGPGNNQAGVGTTTTTETQGNQTNTNPEPQDLDNSSSCNPPKSNGKPCNP